MTTDTYVEPRTKRGERTRDRLIEAAVEEFTAVGFVQARVESITARAEMGYGTFYQYFPNKQAILAYLAEAAYSEMRIPPDDPETARLPMARRVYNHLWFFLTKYVDNARIFRLLDDSMTYDPNISERIWDIQRRQAINYANAMLRHEDTYHPIGGDRYSTAQVIGAMSYEVGRRFVRTHRKMTPAAQTELATLTKLLTVMTLAAINPSSLGIKPTIVQEILEFA